VINRSQIHDILDNFNTDLGKTTLSIHPQYFVDGRVSWHTKKGR